MQPLQTPLTPPHLGASRPTTNLIQLRQAAEQLESGFLAEFLKSAGFGETSASFGGGTGEDQFASFLRQAQADAMVKAGGIGLSDAIYASLLDRHHAE